MNTTLTTIKEIREALRDNTKYTYLLPYQSSIPKRISAVRTHYGVIQIRLMNYPYYENINPKDTIYCQ